MSKPTRTVLAAQDLAGQAPTRIQLLPKEAVTGRSWSGKNGAGPYSVPDIKAVIAASQLPAYIDYDHLSDLPHGLGTEKPAAGWINALHAEADGLWGEVEWTPKAGAAIADKEYRFISPAFDIDDGKRITRLVGAGLTNKPNFTMTALASEIADPTQKTEQKETSMDKTQLAALCAALAISADSDATQIVTAAQGVRAQLDLASKHLNLSGKSSLEIASAASTALARLDLGAYVPKADHDKVVTELASVTGKMKDADAIAAVDVAAREGKVSPALRPWAEGEAKRDLASFQAWAKVAPVVVEPGSIKTEIAASAENGNVVTGYTPPAGFSVRPDRAQLHAKALAHQAKNPTLTYEQAVLAVDRLS